MTDTKYDVRQMVRLSAAGREKWPDIGAVPGMIERMHFSRDEVTVRWLALGTAINLGFGDIEATE